MAKRKKVTLQNLLTAESRRQLANRKKHAAAISSGAYLVHRPARPGDGTFYSRLWSKAAGKYFERKIAAADDKSVANGVDVMSQSQAMAVVLARRDRRSGAPGSMTLDELMYGTEDQLGYLPALETGQTAKRGGRRDNGRTRSAYKTNTAPFLGKTKVEQLTGTAIAKWHRARALAPATRRSGKVVVPKTPEEIRRRQDSANRNLRTLMACLQWGEDQEYYPANGAWKTPKVKPFSETAAPRGNWLNVDGLQRFLNGCRDPAFRDKATAAALTGCRDGELNRLDVADFDPESSTLTIRLSKAGRARHVFLSTEAAALFNRLTVGRPGDEPLLRRADGRRWGRNDQQHKVAAACKIAGIHPPIRFHELRHSFASISYRQKMPTMVLARALGHTTTKMVELFYTHLDGDDFVAKEIRAKGPELGTDQSTNVVTVPTRRTA